jgi:uncharacterized protein YraI
MMSLFSPPAWRWRGPFLCVLLACSLSPTFNRPLAQAQDAIRTYRVVHVEGDDVLNIRTGPSGDSRIVGAIPPTGRGVALIGHCRTWCLVRYNGVSGWVYARHLAAEPAVAPFVQRAPAAAPAPAAPVPAVVPTHWRVTGIAANDVLLVRNAPDQQAPVVYVYSPRATCIVFLGGCQKPWCQVQFPAQGGPQTGWVNARFLAPSDEPCG